MNKVLLIFGLMFLSSCEQRLDFCNWKNIKVLMSDDIGDQYHNERKCALDRFRETGGETLERFNKIKNERTSARPLGYSFETTLTKLGKYKYKEGVAYKGWKSPLDKKWIVRIMPVLRDGTGYIHAFTRCMRTWENCDPKTLIRDPKGSHKVEIFPINGVKISNIEKKRYDDDDARVHGKYIKFKYKSAHNGRIRISAQEIKDNKKLWETIVEIPIPYNPYLDELTVLKADNLHIPLKSDCPLCPR